MLKYVTVKICKKYTFNILKQIIIHQLPGYEPITEPSHEARRRIYQTRRATSATNNAVWNMDHITLHGTC